MHQRLIIIFLDNRFAGINAIAGTDFPFTDQQTGSTHNPNRTPEFIPLSQKLPPKPPTEGFNLVRSIADILFADPLLRSPFSPLLLTVWKTLSRGPSHGTFSVCGDSLEIDTSKAGCRALIANSMIKHSLRRAPPVRSSRQLQIKLYNVE